VAGKEIINDRDFRDMKTNIGIVATRWQTEKPMIFKTNVNQAHGRKATFIPGYGVTLLEAIQASCSAYPFFERKSVTTASGDQIDLFDGGFSANNPSLFAIADAVFSLGYQPSNCRLLSIGCGRYPEPSPTFLMRTVRLLPFFTMLSQLLQKTMETNTNTIEKFRSIAFKQIPTVRVNDTYERPDMATDLFEHDLQKLALLRQLGQESFAQHEDRISKLIFDGVQ
jgi:uncharacterized protein